MIGDILHKPVETDDGFSCRDCGIELPFEVCGFGTDVIEVAHMGFIPADPKSPKGVRCGNADKVRDETRDLSKHVVETITSDTELTRKELEERLEDGEKTEIAPPLSDVEKMANRAVMANFWAMREATKLQSRLMTMECDEDE